MTKENLKPLFPSNQIALVFYQDQVRKLELKYGRAFEDLWFETEQSLTWTPVQEEIFSLHNTIKTLHYLVNKENQ